MNLFQLHFNLELFYIQYVTMVGPSSAEDVSTSVNPGRVTQKRIAHARRIIH